MGHHGRTEPGRWLGRSGFGALAAVLVLSALGAREARATSSVTHFSEAGFSGEIALEEVDGIPANADLDLMGTPQDPVSFLVSISLDPGSEILLSVDVSPFAFVFGEPSPLAIGWLPGNGSPGAEPDAFGDVVGYGSSRDPVVFVLDNEIDFGTRLDFEGNFSGGLHPGDTSNLFFVTYERPTAQNLEWMSFRLSGVDLELFPPEVRVPVPEPSSGCLLAGGLGMLLLYARRTASAPWSAPGAPR